MDIGDTTGSERSTTPESDSSDSGSELDDQIRSHEEDDAYLAATLQRANLLPDHVTSDEIAFLPNENVSQATIDMLLTIRNVAVRNWLRDPRSEIGIYELRSSLNPPMNTDTEMIISVHHYLQRNGLINVGRYLRNTAIPNLRHTPKKVIVIGAGLAGIAAATQLQSFGFDVTVLEAENHIGGRVASLHADGTIVEVGGDTINSFKNNPLTVLVQQLPVQPLALNENYQLYDEKGISVDPNVDGLIFDGYKDMKQTLLFLSNKLPDVNKDANSTMYVSRQRGYDNLFNQFELKHAENHLEEWEGYLQLLERQKGAAFEIETLAKSLESLRYQVNQLENELLNERDPDRVVLIRTEIRITLKHAQWAMERFETARKDLAGAREAASCVRAENKLSGTMYYSCLSDFRNFQFYFALEELIYGAELERVQLSEANQRKTMNGASVKIQEGMAKMLSMAIEGKDLDIRLGHVVKNITYDYNGVTVRVQKRVGEKLVEEDVKANICVCTLPLGVLKKSVNGDENAPKFYPPMTEEKVTALSRLGFGTVNKACLVFDNNFWSSGKQTTFGKMTESNNSFLRTRGELMLFQSTPGSRVLYGYLVGASAEFDVPDEIIIRKAMDALVKIFGSAVPKPRYTKVTRWHESEFSFGTHTYMGLETEVAHFEELRRPLRAYRTEDDESDSGPRGGNTKENDPEPMAISPQSSDESFETRFNNKIYFAGEHTSVEQHGTMEGAWLSGIAVAADVANDVTGVYKMDTLENLTNDQLERILNLDEYVQNMRDGLDDDYYDETLESDESNTGVFTELHN